MEKGSKLGVLGTDLNKVLFSTKKYQYFSYFCMKNFVVGTHQKGLNKVLLMRSKTCFCGETRKIVPYLELCFGNYSDCRFVYIPLFCRFFKLQYLTTNITVKVLKFGKFYSIHFFLA